MPISEGKILVNIGRSQTEESIEEKVGGGGGGEKEGEVVEFEGGGGVERCRGYDERLGFGIVVGYNLQHV